MSEWISVKNRLPESMGTYLVVRVGRVAIYAYVGEPAGFGDENVTHWMPIPEPPK